MKNILYVCVTKLKRKTVINYISKIYNIFIMSQVIKLRCYQIGSILINWGFATCHHEVKSQSFHLTWLIKLNCWMSFSKLF